MRILISYKKGTAMVKVDEVKILKILDAFVTATKDDYITLNNLIQVLSNEGPGSGIDHLLYTNTLKRVVDKRQIYHRPPPYY